MKFDSTAYGVDVSRILALDGDGNRPMPLAIQPPACMPAIEALRSRKALELFPNARAPAAALSGLWLYFSCFDESHRISQDIPTPEGSYWHGISHRQEPDPGNAAYWFRRVGRHPVFERLRDEADVVLRPWAGRVRFSVGTQWDPFAFIDFCEYARRRPGTDDEQAASEIQLIEWQLLFDYCAGAGPR